MKISSPLFALAIQSGALLLVLAVLAPLSEHFGVALSIFELMLLQGTLAATVAYRFGAERWWVAIHFGFFPLLTLGARLNLNPGWFLLAFSLLALVYWNSFKTRVPLYLSNQAVATAVAARLAPGSRFADLGSGLGDMLLHLAKGGEGFFFGIESAPLPFLIGKFRCRNFDNCLLEWGDYAKVDLSSFDLVYVFLSPAAMPALWDKARREMQPGSLLISNSFEIEQAAAAEQVAVGGKILYLYQL